MSDANLRYAITTGFYCTECGKLFDNSVQASYFREQILCPDCCDKAPIYSLNYIRELHEQIAQEILKGLCAWCKDPQNPYNQHCMQIKFDANIARGK